MYEPIFDEFTAPQDDQVVLTRRSCSQCGTAEAVGVDGLCNGCWAASCNVDDIL